MHYSNLFNKVYYDNQLVFNKKLNWYFDIKNILFQKENKKKIIQNTNQLIKEYSSLKNINKDKKKNFFKPKYLRSKNFLIKRNSTFRKKILYSISYLKKEKIEAYFSHLLIQGSLATNDFIENWSDFDSVGVIKDEILVNPKKIIKLRKVLKEFYKKVNEFSKFQHHGIILFSEYDLRNFLPGFLPLEALKNKSLSIIKPNIFNINKISLNKKNLSKEILLNRKKYILRGIKKKYYDHHVFDGIKLSIPFKENERTLKQLFVHIGFMLNIPILYLDAINKSSHKKNSFKKFYKIIGNKNIIRFIKKHENLRSNWKFFFQNNQYINKKIINFLGKDYFKECFKTISFCIRKIG